MYQLKSSCRFHSDVAVTIAILYSTELVFKKNIFFLLSSAVKSLSIHSFNYPFMQLTTHTNPSVYPNAVFEDGHLAFHQGLEDNVQVCSHRFHSVQSLSHVQIFVTPWTAACQASLSFTISQSLLKLIPIESVRPSNHPILCCPLLLLPSIFPNVRVFSNESALCIRWPKYWSFSFSISPSNEYSGLTSFRMDWLDLLA